MGRERESKGGRESFRESERERQNETEGEKDIETVIDIFTYQIVKRATNAESSANMVYTDLGVLTYTPLVAIRAK